MEKNKRAILVVSSGTVNEKARRENIEAAEKEIERNFTEYEVRRAFSSVKIVNKLKLRHGIHVDRPEEALAKLKEEGFEEIIIQPLHVIAGDEYEGLQKSFEKFKEDFDKIALGRPLLDKPHDYDNLLQAVKYQLPVLNEGTAAVFMGHGSDHSADESYSIFQSVIDSENLNIFVGTIKGRLAISNIIYRLKQNKIKEVMLMPLMLVAGTHAIKDMASEHKESWKSMLEAGGFKVEVYLLGLGENKEVQKLYVEKVKAAILNE